VEATSEPSRRVTAIERLPAKTSSPGVHASSVPSMPATERASSTRPSLNDASRPAGVTKKNVSVRSSKPKALRARSAR
jgi:hypothetical protein